MVNTNLKLKIFSGTLWSMDTMSKTHLTALGLCDSENDQYYLSTSDIVESLGGKEKILFFSVSGGSTYKIDLNTLYHFGHYEEGNELFCVPFQTSEYSKQDLETIIEVL